MEYFAGKECLFIFITFLVGKDSPFYQDTLSSNDDTWDFSRPSLICFEPLIDLIYMIYRHTADFQKASKEHEDDIGVAESTVKRIISLSIKDLKCLKHTSFLRFVYKNCPKIFPEFAAYLSYGDPDYSIQCCIEITRYLEDMYCSYDLSDMLKLLNAIFLLLRIRDDKQITRMFILIGYPQIAIDEPNSRYNLPYFGFHNMSDFTSKAYEVKGLVNLNNTCTLIKKLYNLHDKDQQAEIFLNILNECKKNHVLLRYLRSFPGEEPFFEDFVKFGMHVVESSFRKTDYGQVFKDIIDILNPVLKSGVLNNMIKNFNGFFGRYLHNDIKREEFTFIDKTESIFIIRCDYYTNMTTYSKTLDFSKSKCYFGAVHKFEEEKSVEKERDSEENNIKSNEKVIVYSTEEKIGNEREWIKSIMKNLTAGQKVVVQNESKVENFKHNLIRFIAINSKIYFNF